MFSVGYQPSRTNIKFFSSRPMPKKVVKDSEPETVEKQEDHTHHKLPPLTKLNQPTSPWQRESSPWLQESPLWQQSFSPWQNDREQSNSKSYSRSGSNQQNGVSNNVKITKSRASRTNAVVSLGGRTVHSEKQRNFTAPNSLFTSTSNSSNTNGYSAVQPSRKLSISTPVLDSRVEVKPPSRGQMQGSRTAPGRNRDQKSNKTYLFCPQRQASTDLQFETDFYMSSLEDEIGREETVDLLPMGGIENYKHFALRNPNHRAEIDLQRVYDRTYRPSLKLPKCNGTIVTTINPQFINNNCSSRQHAILRKAVPVQEHNILSRNSSNSSGDIKSVGVAEDIPEGKRVRIITPAKCSPTKKQSSERNLSWLSYRLPCSSAWGFRKDRTYD